MCSAFRLEKTKIMYVPAYLRGFSLDFVLAVHTHEQYMQFLSHCNVDVDRPLSRSVSPMFGPLSPRVTSPPGYCAEHSALWQSNRKESRIACCDLKADLFMFCQN